MHHKTNVLIVSATEFEILPLLDYLNDNWELKSEVYESETIAIHVLVTGVGMVATTFTMASFLAHQKIDLAFNFGIAGAFNRAFKLGEVYHVQSDCFADLGIELPSGQFQDLFQLDLMDENQAPFINKKLYSPLATTSFLPSATALTVNKVTGTESSIASLQRDYDVDLETMEGAAFYYCCNLHRIEAAQIRAISNYVEPRNKNNWEIPLAIEALNAVAVEMIKTFEMPKA